MTESPTPPNNPTPESTSGGSSGKSSNVAVPIILGCLGCGCLSLIVVSILAAIALPGFLNQANRARESEGKTYVGSILRGQQAHYLENGEFAATLEDLALGIDRESSIYSYRVEVQPDGTSVVITAAAKDEGIRSYVGAAFAIGDDPILAIPETQVCESDSPTPVPPAPPILVDPTTPTIECAPGSTEI